MDLNQLLVLGTLGLMHISKKLALYEAIKIQTFTFQHEKANILYYFYTWMTYHYWQ